MRLRNDTRICPERPQTPETPETSQSEDSVVPWVKDEVPKKKSPRFLEDILAEEVMYPVCQTLWHIFLTPLWQWTLRPTLWECLLRPFLWQRVIRQGVWEGISQQILWEGVLQHILFEDDLGDDVVPPIPATRGDITCVCPVRKIIWDPILRPVLSQVRLEELFSLLFVMRISTRITFSSSDAYIFTRGYRPDTEEFSERSDTEFGQIPFQERRSWNWVGVLQNLS
ncbi:hypothetical protein FLAG1_05353 [Fusarium langsethiae]|uniref:Uncharacterized protein n=1 Tax=Fusarium langsethiae TaxID=179993 RepID=A0A0M9EXG7_FUSLA|nr:hypothetical protein FLAG1_05353 [Fusarium langsethiae]GKT98166.1 unnamed protein product [Fusarium langsethiae]GKU19958.1 unnamed protein product [Fusarium langsethiae]